MRELFLTSFCGWQYGIWKDQIKSVRDIHALHRIPLSPAGIAGILIDNGQAVTLADLSACIGYGHTTVTGQGSILLMEEGEKVTGFAVSGGMDTAAHSRRSPFSRSRIFSGRRCSIPARSIHGIPIPIINVAELYSRVMKAQRASSVDSPRISPVRSPDISGDGNDQAIFRGGRDLCLACGEHRQQPGQAGSGHAVAGHAVVCEGRHVPGGAPAACHRSVAAYQRAKLPPAPLMLVAGTEGGSFGLLVDGDMGTVPAVTDAIKPVPVIASKPWLKHAMLRGGEPIPLVDIDIVLSPGSGAADEIPVWQRYTASSRFPDLFFKHDVEVVEFSLLGERHALPKLEVEEVIACKPWRAFPDAPPVVLGVTGHNGEILPVVDLAMMFGRLSLVTPAWRMMLVNNGDFRALAITETVFRERRLAPDIHRAVPIHLPHNLMYGCYPDAEAVRLILNVEAISVHFEKSLIQQFLPALSQEMKMVSAQAAPDHQEKSNPRGRAGCSTFHGGH